MAPFLPILGLALGLSSCALIPPRPEKLSFSDRLMDFPQNEAPVRKPLKITWDPHAIPFLEAENDEDAAFGLGLVHAHLRLGQLQLLRFLSQGRTSELGGPIPFLATLDQGIRTLNLRGAAQASEASLSPETKLWLRAFTQGINWYITHSPRKTFEQRLFGFEEPPFTELDILTIGKLASADLSWGFYFRFLKLAETQGWEEALSLFLKHPSGDSVSYEPKNEQAFLRLLEEGTRSGSNSVAIDAHRSATGGALLANDPHVGLFLPNFWLLAGLKSPRYHVVGMMLPGLPFFALGRNPHLAWGGTNMRAISSHLYDVSDLPQDQITVRKEVLKRRWWWSKTVEIRETSWGPILTDLDFFDAKRQPFTAALSWLGKDPSDEIGSFLKASRARDGREFREAFTTYRVSAMNLLYAEQTGRIGMLPAYAQAVLKDPAQTLLLVKPRDNRIEKVLTPLELPWTNSPPGGLLASANNRPFPDAQNPLSFNFAPSERHDRMLALLKPKEKIQLADLKEIQSDVYSSSSVALRDLLLQKCPESSLSFWQDLRAWPGTYSPESQGAAALEQVISYAWEDFKSLPVKNEALAQYLATSDSWKPLLTQWLQETETTDVARRCIEWQTKAAQDHQKSPRWGDLHQIKLQSPLAAIPWLGRHLQRKPMQEGGSNETLYKNGRRLSPHPGQVTYGAAARHLSDMSDPDANYFVLKGGQDAWLESPQLDDQVELWNRGQYIQLPLSEAARRSVFSAATITLQPLPHRNPIEKEATLR